MKQIQGEPMLTLAGKAIIVTGAGQGLGAAYALELARLGADLVLNDLDHHALTRIITTIHQSGSSAVAVPGSVADETIAQQMVNAAVKDFGKIDGLVNNAGVFLEAHPWEQTTEDVRKLLEINALAPIVCGTYAIDAMSATGGGSIINVSSGAAIGLGRQSAYAASKGAVLSLTYSWALELAEHNIRVNALSPRAYTPMIEGSEVTRDAVAPDEKASQIAPLVAYLLSDAAAGVTGQFIRACGEEISLVGPPSVSAPLTTSAGWTVDQLADAFACLNLKPVGLFPRDPGELLR